MFTGGCAGVFWPGGVRTSSAGSFSGSFNGENSGPLAHCHGWATFSTRKRWRELRDPRMRTKEEVFRGGRVTWPGEAADHQSGQDHDRRLRVLRWSCNNSHYWRATCTDRHSETEEDVSGFYLRSSTERRQDVREGQARRVPLQDVSCLQGDMLTPLLAG